MLRHRGARPEGSSVSWSDLADDNNPNGKGVDEVTEISIQRERVRSALAQLPADQQEALALAYFRGYTHREIAEVLKEPLGTVKSRIRLGMQKLRQMLEEE
jgi:RNA polymerase sigma-70 factor, ECF subfamily